MNYTEQVDSRNWFSRVVDWNRVRKLIERGFSHEKEASFIIEELLESTGKYDSESARERALEISTAIVGGSDPAPELIVDAWADIIVFATGAIAKLGYDPAKVMEEVYLEINSRTGRIIDGKFVRNPDVVPYTADFSACKF